MIPKCRLEQRPELRLEQLLASRSSRAWVSAKGAVDNDLVQSALEEGELLIIELGDEQLRDPAGVDGRGLGEAGDARLRERPKGPKARLGT